VLFSFCGDAAKRLKAGFLAFAKVR
jgi:hypothetical protein